MPPIALASAQSVSPATSPTASLKGVSTNGAADLAQGNLAQATGLQNYIEGQQSQKAIDQAALSQAQAANADTAADATSTARLMATAKSAVNFNMGLIVGSYATVARLLDEAAAVPGTSGLMLVFDDFLAGMDAFGQRIQPLMRCRQDRMAAA